MTIRIYISNKLILLKEKWKIIFASIFSISLVVGVYAGLYQDMFKPMYLWSKNENSTVKETSKKPSSNQQIDVDKTILAPEKKINSELFTLADNETNNIQSLGLILSAQFMSYNQNSYVKLIVLPKKGEKMIFSLLSGYQKELSLEGKKYLLTVSSIDYSERKITIILIKK